MAVKCDIRLAWWISLANLHHDELSTVVDVETGNPGFVTKVRKLAGQPPPAVEALLNPGPGLEDAFSALVNQPDGCLWKLAGVADSILSRLCELQESGKLPQAMSILDWSDFVAPINLDISSDGKVVQAHRPDPLANDLLTLIQGRNIASFGRCPVCARLFERRRRDQQCDSRACRDVERQRRFRRRHRNKSFGF